MANSLYQKHIISIPELSREELELIVETAGQLKKEPRPELIKNKVVASCFFEPSTRTRLSFETAIQRIGGDVIGFDNGGNTSLAKKGETLSDSVQVISSYVDAFVMRHPQEGYGKEGVRELANICREQMKERLAELDEEVKQRNAA